MTRAIKAAEFMTVDTTKTTYYPKQLIIPKQQKYHLQSQILGPIVNEQESFSNLWNVFNVICGETRWCAMRRAQDAAKNWRAPLHQVSMWHLSTKPTLNQSSAPPSFHLHSPLFLPLANQTYFTES